MVKNKLSTTIDLCKGPLLLIVTSLAVSKIIAQDVCVDSDDLCRDWARNNQCVFGSYVWMNCRPSCGLCQPQTIVRPADKAPPEYDIQNLPPELKNLGFLVGKWRSEFSGKADFPTIPRFTYGEKISFSIAEPTSGCGACLNYSAIAWGLNTKQDLHSEHGFLKSDGFNVSMITAMNNGFTMLEEGGVVQNGRVQLRMQGISRVHFGRDLPVISALRVFEQSGEHLVQAFYMGTITHTERQHTQNIYNRVAFPK